MDADGQIEEFWKHTVWLHGSSKGAYRSDPVFFSNSDAPRILRVHIDEVSRQGDNSICILLDGAPAAGFALPGGAAHSALEAAIPAGTHEVQVRNMGDDWLRIENYAFGGPDLNVLRAIGLAAKAAAYLWIYDGESRYGQTSSGQITNAEFSLFDLDPGDYRIEYHRTRAPGGILHTEECSTSDGILIGHIPDFTKDVAVKVMRPRRVAKAR